MVTPICALPPLSASLCESESHLNVQRRTLLSVIGACRDHRGGVGWLFLGCYTEGGCGLVYIIAIQDVARKKPVIKIYVGNAYL